MYLYELRVWKAVLLPVNKMMHNQEKPVDVCVAADKWYRNESLDGDRIVWIQRKILRWFKEARLAR